MWYIFAIINRSATMIDLNEGWQIYKIVEPVVSTAVAFLVSAFSDLAIDPEFSW